MPRGGCFVLHSVFVFGNTTVVTSWLGIGIGPVSVGVDDASHNSQDYWTFINDSNDFSFLEEPSHISTLVTCRNFFQPEYPFLGCCL